MIEGRIFQLGHGRRNPEAIYPFGKIVPKVLIDTARDQPGGYLHGFGEVVQGQVVSEVNFAGFHKGG